MAVGPPSPRTSRIQTLLKHFDVSVDKRKELSEGLAPLLPVLIQNLAEKAKGVWIVGETTDKNGKPKKLIYQRAPDLQAIELCLQLIGPMEAANALLTYVKIEQAVQELDAGIAKARAEQMLSQARLNQENASVFQKMLMERSEVEDVTLGSLTHAVGKLQAVPREMMLENCRDEPAYQKFLARFADDVLNYAAEKLGVDRETKAIESE